MNAFVIDAFEFCRIKERREGAIAVADLPRLVEDCADTSGTLQWSLEGGMHKLGFPQFSLSVSATVQLMCQRCLTPYPFVIGPTSILVLAKDDEAADEIEAMLDDESIDVIVGNKAFNIRELIEDEALLALPLSPRHPVCPDVSLMEAAQDEKELPFSALKGLKQ
jgi:uncharacterized protein